MLSTHSLLVAPAFCLAPPLLQRACLSSHAPRVSRPRVNYFVKWPEVVDLGFIYVWCFCYTCFTKLFLRWNMFCLKQLCLCWVRSSLADFVVFIKTLPVYYFVYQSNVWKQLNLNNGTVGQIIQGTHLNYLLCCALLGQVCWGRYVLPPLFFPPCNNAFRLMFRPHVGRLFWPNPSRLVTASWKYPDFSEMLWKEEKRNRLHWRHLRKHVHFDLRRNAILFGASAFFVLLMWWCFHNMELQCVVQFDT